MRTTNIQFTGLASGMDTNSVVDALMTPYKLKIDKEKEEQQMMQWQQEVWKDVNRTINQFQADWVDKLDKVTNFDTLKATSSSDKASVTATVNASKGTHEITVEQLAQGAFTSSSLDIPKDVEVSTTLKELIGLNTEEEIILHQGTDKEQRVKITSEDTLATLATKLEQADPNLNINFDTDNNKLFVSTDGTGASSTIDIRLADSASPEGKAALSKIGLGEPIKAEGQNAKYSYNGIALESESNNLNVNGLQITLNDKTEVGESIKIQVNEDVDSVVETISGFVDAYNKLIGDLNERVGAKSSKQKPLTDAQKAEMTPEAIKAHEESIKKTLLSGDDNLEKLLTQMRSTLQGSVAGEGYNTLSEIGITTGKYADKGKLILDKDKLTEMLKNDAESVKNLFVGENGIATKLSNGLKELEKGVNGLKTYDSFYNDKTLVENIKDSNSKLKELEERYERMEAIYFAKFTAMETALSQLNAQGDSIASMLAPQ